MFSYIYRYIKYMLLNRPYNLVVLFYRRDKVKGGLVLGAYIDDKYGQPDQAKERGRIIEALKQTIHTIKKMEKQNVSNNGSAKE